MLKIKRIYDPPSRDDGMRVLVDLLWPRGLTKEKAKIDLWIKEAAPGTELRKWFNHEPEKWEAFKQRFFAELDKKPEAVEDIIGRARKGTVTLLFGSKEERFNNAVALKEYIEMKMRARGSRKAA